MGPPSLFSICINEIAFYIENGVLENYSIPEKISNSLLQNLHPPFKTPKVMEKFFKNSKITRIELTAEYLVEIKPALFGLQELEHLQLDFSDKDDYNDMQRGMKMNLGNFDILTILEWILGCGSRKKMRSLTLLDCEVYSTRRLMGKIGHLVPNLTSLDLGYTKISKIEFKAMCLSFPNLTNLSIAHASRQSLDGISNLKNLEILNIMFSNMGTSDAIQEIFQLKKLKVLDISGFGEHGVNNIGSYLECNENLPELRFLDISFNYITEEQFGKLVESHPKLEKIGLIGTPLERREQFPNKTPELLTIRTLESCIKSFKHHTDRRDRHKTLAVLEEMENILEHRYEEQTDEALKDCLMAILPTDSTTNWDLTEEKIVNCLYFLCGCEGRSRRFDFHQIQLLIDTLLNKCSYKWTREEDDDYIYIIQKIVWRIMNNEHILNNNKQDIDGICDKAAFIVEQSNEIEDEEAPAIHCMAILERYLGLMTPDALHRMSHDRLLGNNVLYFMDTRDFVGKPLIYFSFLTVSRSLICNKHEVCCLMLRVTASIWLGNLEKFQGNRRMEMNTLNTLNITMRKIRDFGFLFADPNFSILTKFLTYHGRRQQTAAIHCFIRARLYTRLRILPPNEAFIQKTVDRHLSATNEIRKDLEKFVPNPGDTIKLAVYKWLVTNGSRRSKGLAQWILGHFPEAEEPRAKRRRIVF